MRRQLIADLICPYCGGTMSIAHEVEGDAERLRYGLLGCRCFEFPVVDGILLLSLAKGYGGAEERLQPYVPLQVAALHYLRSNDLLGLRNWIRRHIPLAAELMQTPPASYLAFTGRMEAQLAIEIDRELTDYGRFEHVGYGSRLHGPSGSAMRRLRQLRRRLKLRPPRPLEHLRSYYVSRFFSPRVNALALQLDTLPFGGRTLSLCCGQGMFENLLRLQGRATEVVSVDGQFLNLLITRHFIAGSGSFICHDVQFPLPFRDGYFDATLSSTCLPEIPAQQTFAREAVRVTSMRGWTLFDSIWNVEMGVQRVNPHRHYRICQNFFASLDDYLPFFVECAPGRQVGVDIPDVPGAYLAPRRWLLEPHAAKAAVASRPDLQLSVLVLGAHFRGWVAPDRAWLRGDLLRVSPVFEVRPEGDDTLRLRRRLDASEFSQHFSPSRFAGFPDEATLEVRRFAEPTYLSELFCAGIAVLLPVAFDPSISVLSGYESTLSAHPYDRVT